MRLKSLLVSIGIAACSTVYAANVHIHPQASDTDKKVLSTQGVNSKNACEIAIENNSSAAVHVSGIFDDNTRLDDFYVNPGYRDFIDLYYYGYCHASMYLEIQSYVYPYPVLYRGQTPVGSNLRIVNSLSNTIKVETTRN